MKFFPCHQRDARNGNENEFLLPAPPDKMPRDLLTDVISLTIDDLTRFRQITSRSFRGIHPRTSPRRYFTHAHVILQKKKRTKKDVSSLPPNPPQFPRGDKYAIARACVWKWHPLSNSIPLKRYLERFAASGTDFSNAVQTSTRAYASQHAGK